MASPNARHGSKAYISVNGQDLSQYCNNADLAIEGDTADTSTFGNLWKTSIAGMIGAKLDLTGDYDPAATGPALVLIGCITGAVPVAVVYRPGGTLAGQLQHAFNVLVKSYAPSSPVGGAVTFKSALEVTGAVTTTTQ